MREIERLVSDMTLIFGRESYNTSQTINQSSNRRDEAYA